MFNFNKKFLAIGEVKEIRNFKGIGFWEEIGSILLKINKKFLQINRNKQIEIKNR